MPPIAHVIRTSAPPEMSMRFNMESEGRDSTQRWNKSWNMIEQVLEQAHDSLSYSASAD